MCQKLLKSVQGFSFNQYFAEHSIRQTVELPSDSSRILENIPWVSVATQGIFIRFCLSLHRDPRYILSVLFGSPQRPKEFKELKTNSITDYFDTLELVYLLLICF